MFNDFFYKILKDFFFTNLKKQELLSQESSSHRVSREEDW